MHAQSLKLETRQTLTPRLQYAVRLLQLSSLDYEQELNDVMGKNPFLEADESRSVPPPADEGLWSATATAPGVLADALADAAGDAPDPDRSAPLDLADERDTTLQDPGGARDGTGNSQTSALDMMVADVGLRQHLRSQASTLALSPRERTLVCTLVESLDDDGYLRLPLPEVAELAALVPAADPCEAGVALQHLQSFDPPGVGARDLCECLVLQLEELAPGARELAHRILTDHLDRLAQRDVSGIARRLGRSICEVDAACAAIRRLDPRPGLRFGSADVHYVTPDVVVRKVRGTWQVRLNPAVVPRVRLNETYAELFRRHREARHAEMAAHLQEARWTLRNVEQRFSTILTVAQAILRRQYRFFEYGAFAMKPLGLREVADEVGLHESTVCRVTNNKFMATPAGVFELKHFFSRPMPMTSGGACSATAIRGVMREMLDAEDPRQPLSDVDIAHDLTRQGLRVARRTVTKYRQMLKVAPAERRRRVDSHAAAAA